MSNEVYRNIISEYLKASDNGEKPSISKVAKMLKVSEERVRRVLITEGLWTSRTAKLITDLYSQGKTISEIAQILIMSEKNVQSYIPYSRGMYGDRTTPDAVRSDEYRKRMKQAAEHMHSKKHEEEVMENKNEWEKEYELREKARLEEIRNATEELYKRFNRVNIEDCLDIAVKRRSYTMPEYKQYQLKFDLISNPTFYHKDDMLGMNERERKELLKLAKAEKGISRTAIVPGDMNLHALHYMIQKMFGWQNSHLHMFNLTEDNFQSVTAGRLGEWEKLCGVIFRFPDADLSDIYWDDDYEEGISPKTWMKRKYSAPYQAKCVSESFLHNLQETEDFDKHFGENGSRKQFMKDALIEEVLRKVGFEEYTVNILAERLSVKELFVKADRESSAIPNERLDAWHMYMMGERELLLKEWKRMKKEDPFTERQLIDNMEQLITWRHNRDACERGVRYGNESWIKQQIGITPKQLLKQSEYRIPDLEEKCFHVLDAFNPVCYPLFPAILYNYDYGDDWMVRISCEEIYTRKDEWDFPDPYGYVLPRTVNEKDAVNNYRYFDTSGDEASEEIRNILAVIDAKKKPICIKMDGPMLLDDVGGIHGFHDMLKMIRDPDPEIDTRERKETMAWARGMGWTGRTPKPENLL